MSEFTAAKAHAIELEQANGQRNVLYGHMEDIYWMRWPEEEAVRNQVQNVKVTRTPRGRNAILGAKRLLMATDPIISVPSDTNSPAAKEQADKIEKFLKASLKGSDRVAGNPIHYDAILSALLYGDVVIGISSTKEMLERVDASNKAIVRRLKDITARTPFLFEVYNPKSCYFERDSMGLNTFFRKVIVTAGYIEDHFGKDGIKALKSGPSKSQYERNKAVTLCDYYDLKYRHLWLENHEDPIISDDHNLPVIPVACAISEGSQLFDKPEEQREPFLFTAWKSGVIDRENLILTVLYSTLFSIGSNAMFVDYLHDPDNPHPVDYSQAGGTIHYRVGERREVMTRQVIDPAMMEAWGIANDLEMQSTLYRSALGEPVSSDVSYSSYSLMTQSGRLPLIATQRMTGNVMAEALEIGLKWVKDEGKEVSASFETIQAELVPADIPDIVDVKVQLEIELPQDRLQMANAANMLAQGDRPLVSKRWVRENVLNVGQSADMTREIWDESTAEVFYQKMLYENMAQIAQLKQMAMQPPEMMASGVPGAQAPTPVGPGGMMPPAMGQEGGPQPNFGTPPQPNMPPGPQPVEPMMPPTPMVPNQMPFNRNTLRGPK